MQQNLLDTHNLDVVDDRCVELFGDGDGPFDIFGAGHRTRNDRAFTDRRDFQRREWKLRVQNPFNHSGIGNYRDVDGVLTIIRVPNI